MFKKIMIEIIDKKYEDLGLNEINKNHCFWKIKNFEGNAIGQIGEEFVRRVFKRLQIPLSNDKKVIHDEYDILSSGIKIEVKAARKGSKNNTFQFNGINPRYNYKYLIFIGLTSKDILYKIVSKKNIEYLHKKRKYFVDLGNNKKQLVKMNPNNEVNFKLTLNIKDMDFVYKNFELELGNIFK